MKLQRLITIFLAVLLPCALSGAAPIGAPLWNPETRAFALGSPANAPWLIEGATKIKLAGGQVISTRVARFKVTIAETRDSHVLTRLDEGKVLDWELRGTAVAPSSVRLDWMMTYRSAKPLQLDRIDVLTGKLAARIHRHDFDETS